MTARLLATVALLGLGLGLAGCHRSYKPAPNPVEIDPAEYDRIFRASVEVLRDYGFRVDRQDYRFGRVTSAPLASPTVFEPWINHNTTATQTAQSTLDFLRRTVTVSMEPSAEESSESRVQSPELDRAAASPNPELEAQNSEPLSPPYHLRVEVLLENQQVPIRRLNGSVSGSRFSSLTEVPTEWADRNIAPAYWQPIGRDAHLEDRLARDIMERSLRLPE